MDNAEVASIDIVNYMVENGLFDTDWMGRRGFTLEGMKLWMASTIRSAYGEPDEEIPFSEEVGA